MTPRRRLFVLLALIACASAACLAFAPHSASGLRTLIAGYGSAAPLVLLAIWVVLTPALVSGTALAAASGLLLGTGLGTAVALAGATFGGLAAFALGRRLGHDGIETMTGPKLRRISDGLADRGFLAVLSLRVAPGMPATWLNYAAGLSRIRARHFALGILIGGAPRIFAYTALGGSIGNLGSPVGLVAVTVLALMTVLGALLAWRTARRLRVAPA